MTGKEKMFGKVGDKKLWNMEMFEGERMSLMSELYKKSGRII